MRTDFFIVGAPKAGTTSLHAYLGQHPLIVMSSIKEPNYFTSDEVQQLYYNVMPVNNQDDYEELFRGSSNENVRGEASVSYLYYQEVPKRLLEYNPRAKIIIMLRDPSDRAFSHFLMDQRLGFVPKDVSFEDIFYRRSGHNLESQYYQQFFGLGLYYSQVLRYQSVFDKEQVKIFLFEDLGNDSMQVVEDTLHFLGIDSVDLGDLESVHNPQINVGDGLFGSIYKNKKIRRLAKSIFGERGSRLVKSQMATGGRPVMDDSMRKALRSFYSEDIEKLSRILDRDLSNWYE